MAQMPLKAFPDDPISEVILKEIEVHIVTLTTKMVMIYVKIVMVAMAEEMNQLPFQLRIEVLFL